jgi:opacity protein-like surface antigen
MKKKLALVVVFMFLMSSVALAAPLTNYEAGKASIDLNFRNTKNTETFSFGSYDYKSKYNFEPSVTVGIANRWALQYRNVNAKSKNTGIWLPDDNCRVSVNEFNILYSLTENVSAFTGYVQTKDKWAAPGAFQTTKRNTWQLGLLGVAPVSEKVSLYGLVGAGGKYTNFEVGISYAFTENWEFNVDYRALQAKELKDGGIIINDAKAKGVGFGLTYKFN